MAVSLQKIQKWVKRKNSKKIISVLNNDDYETRINAIRALSSFKSLDVINQLVNLLRDPNPEIRIASVETLGEIGSGKSTEFIRFLLEKEDNEKVIEAARNALASIKENAELEENA